MNSALALHDRPSVSLGVARPPPGCPSWQPPPGPGLPKPIFEFFTATIRNRNTRLAYARACYQFFYWCQENGLTLDTVRPFHVAAYIEQMPGSKPTIKQKLAAIRMLYDFLVSRQLVPVNPTASVRGPKYVVKRGKTPVWSREDAKKLLESIPRDDLAGLRDQALLGSCYQNAVQLERLLNEAFFEFHRREVTERRVVGWKLADRLEAELVHRALQTPWCCVSPRLASRNQSLM